MEQVGAAALPVMVGMILLFGFVKGVAARPHVDRLDRSSHHGAVLRVVRAYLRAFISFGASRGGFPRTAAVGAAEAYFGQRSLCLYARLAAAVRP